MKVVFFSALSSTPAFVLSRLSYKQLLKNTLQNLLQKGIQPGLNL